MKKLESRTERFHYKGSLEEYQLKIQSEGKYQEVNYSTYQNYLYKRALYGVSGLSKDERINICEKKKHRISKVYYKGQVAINVYKQKLTNAYSNDIIAHFFSPESPIAEFFIDNSETDKAYRNTLTFKDLNINKEKIISIFIEGGILPKNFHTLLKDPNQLPRLKNASKEENM
jgi:DNA repair exonuclease SbcCD nuclease subunit